MAAARSTSVHRVVRYRVDARALTDFQVELLERHAGTARAVWNWALAERNAFEDAVRDAVRSEAAEAARGDEDAVAQLMADDSWRRTAYQRARKAAGRAPSSTTLGRRFTELAQDPEGRFGWWKTEKHGVNRFAMSSSLRELDAAFDRYWKNPGGRRTGKVRKDGRPAAWPRFKRKGRSKDAFALYNLVIAGQDPWRMIEGGHRIKVPSIGSLRVQDNTRRLRRLIKRGGRPTSARFTRTGGHWYVAVVVALPAPGDGIVHSPAGARLPGRPTQSQAAAGLVGVDLGVKVLATMSDGTTVANHAHGRAAARKLARLQRKAARQQGPRKGVAPSKSWIATQRQIARLQHDVAARRRGVVHELTKHLATSHAVVAVEDLNVAGMTASPAAVPDPARPGSFLANGRAAKSGLAKAILDVGFGELRRQLTYKAPMYGARLVEVARFAPTSKTCSSCGAVRAKLRLDERTYRCGECGLVMDRDLNAALNIAALGRQAMGSSPADAGDTKRRDQNRGVGAPVPVMVSQDLGPPPRPVERVIDSASHAA